MKIKFPSIIAPAIVALLALTLGSGMASAIPLFPGSGTTAGTQFEDDDIDYFIDNNNNGIIDVGDVLIAAIEFTRVIDVLPPLDPASPYTLNQAADELVAWAVIQVIPNLPTDPVDRIRFGQLGGTPMVQFFTGGAINLNVFGDPSLAQAQAAVFDGAPLWAFSITADPDTEWFFDPSVAGANNPAAVALIGAATKVGTVNYALNQVSGPDDFDLQAIGIACGTLFRCAGDGLVDLVGSADILGGAGLQNGAFARSDADVLLNPSAIPEPSTLVLLGLGLGLLGVMRRRKA